MPDNQNINLDKALRLKHIRTELLRINQDEFAKRIGSAQSNVGKMESGKRPIGSNVEYKVLNEFGIDPQWWETGDGTPFLTDDVRRSFTPFRKRSNAKDKGDYHPEEGERYIRKSNEYVVVEQGNYRLKVKKVDQKAFAGYLAGWADPQYIESLPFTIVTVKEFHSGEYRSFEVSGDSMDYDGKRAIEDGDHVIGRRIEQDLWSSKLHIKQWREWVIVHDEGIVVKHIIKHDVENGIITCRSYNEDKIAYPDFDLHLDDVYELYNVVKVEKNR